MKTNDNSGLPNTSFQVFEAADYYSELLRLLPKAKTRIVLAAMGVLWGEKTDAIFTEIKNAQQRGVRVHILADVYTKTGIGFKGGKKAFKPVLGKTLAIFKEIQKNGGRVHLTGKIQLNPFKGRCHVKCTVVDDNCFSFGGVNFVDSGFKNHDYMLYAKSAELADCLEQLTDRIAQANGVMADGEVPLGKNATILFDGGKPKESIIYKRATELAQQAKQVWYVSQWTPSGPLAYALRAADTHYFFTRPIQMIEAPARWGQAFDQQRYRVTNSYVGKDYIHAKFILFELKDGTKALLSGSHNFSYRGVSFGTKEIALYSTDQHLWEQLYTFIAKHISVQ